MQAGPETKEKSLTSVVGAAEIRQTAEGIEIINHGPEPIEVRLSERFNELAEIKPYLVREDGESHENRG